MLREIVRRVALSYVMGGDDVVFAARKTRMERLRGRSMAVEWDPEKKLFLVTDQTGKVYVSRKERVPLQNIGVAARRKKLLLDYLGHIEVLSPCDIVIDCGANIGEFSVECALAGCQVHAFEPDPKEFAALTANMTGDMTVVNNALWHTTETLPFYDKNEDGDSSLFETGNAVEVIEVSAVRLEDYAAQAGIDHVRLIKVEAEGAEPEVLEGAGELLERTDYVAIDMGPERGMSQENTVVAVHRKLEPYGFRLVHFDHMRCCGLFARS